MLKCEKCWSDAYLRMQGNHFSQTENYMQLLCDRADNPCTPEQQMALRELTKAERIYIMTRPNPHRYCNPSKWNDDGMCDECKETAKNNDW